MKKSQNPLKFQCLLCDYVSCSKKDFSKHLQTMKHLSNDQQCKEVLKTQKSLNSPTTTYHHKIYNCICGKIYMDYSGLWRHKKKCFLEQNNNIEPTFSKKEEITDESIIKLLILEILKLKDNEKPIEPIISKSEEISDKEIIKLLIHENSEFKNMILELVKKDTLNITNTNSNNNNKTFNLQIFLNEDCKNAMNINEFVSLIKMDLNDLEKTGRLGYVTGVSNIINKNLSDLDQTMRPIHCSDAKREVFYVKTEDQWIKETDAKPVLTKAIKQIAHENIRQISTWQKKYPDCTDVDSKKNDMYLNIVSNAMSGGSTEEQLNNYDKIITNVAKEVTIEKQ